MNNLSQGIIIFFQFPDAVIFLTEFILQSLKLRLPQLLPVVTGNPEPPPAIKQKSNQEKGDEEKEELHVRNGIIKADYGNNEQNKTA